MGNYVLIHRGREQEAGLIRAWMTRCNDFLHAFEVDVSLDASLKVTVVPLPYDLIDADLDFDEAAYADDLKRFRRQLLALLTDLLRYRRDACGIQACSLVIRRMITRTQIEEDRVYDLEVDAVDSKIKQTRRKMI